MNKFKPMPTDEHTVSPYLTVKDAEGAIAFYQQVFGAKEVGRLMMMGMIGHAELRIGDSKIMLAEENIEWGNKSPATLGDTPVTITMFVGDVDATYKLALAAGAKELMPIKDEFYGYRVAVFSDPFGHKWHIHTLIEDVSFEEMQRRCDAMFAAKN